MKLKAQEVPWSSVVGNGVMLLNEHGACVAILGIRIPSPGFPLKETSLEVARIVTEAINKGPDDPELKECRRALEDIRRCIGMPSGVAQSPMDIAREVRKCVKGDTK